MSWKGRIGDGDGTGMEDVGGGAGFGLRGGLLYLYVHTHAESARNPAANPPSKLRLWNFLHELWRQPARTPVHLQCPRNIRGGFRWDDHPCLYT